jgi:hypothetical protein
MQTTLYPPNWWKTLWKTDVRTTEVSRSVQIFVTVRDRLNIRHARPLIRFVFLHKSSIFLAWPVSDAVSDRYIVIGEVVHNFTVTGKCGAGTNYGGLW